MTRSSTELRIRDVPIKDIDRSRNTRIPKPGDAELLEGVKKSIEARGQLQAIRVYERGDDQKDPKHKQPYILSFGARRCAALELLGRSTVQAVVFPPASYAEIAEARAVENLHRLGLTPLEELLAVADVFEAIKAEPTFTGDLYEEAATRIGCEIPWVKDRDYLDRLTKPVQQFALRSGLPAGHLRELAKVGDPGEQIRLSCEAAGAPPHAFPADLKKSKVMEWQQKMQDNYFAELADGKIQRWPLSRLKEQVARVRLSLRQIPWEFDKPVQFGAVKLRKCAGCPHNSEFDRTLFGIDEDASNPNGYCLFSSCYNAKQQAADAAKEQVLKKISAKQDQTPEAIRKASPDWVKEPTMVGYVKRQLEKAKVVENGGGSTPKPKAVPTGRPLTDHELALRKFDEVFDDWQQEAFTDVLKGINADPLHRVNWCVLLGVSAFWDHPRVEIPTVQSYSPEPCTAEPVFPPLSEEVEKAIALAFKGTRNGWIELLKDCEQPTPDERRNLGIPHPKVLELLADAMMVKLPSMPEWKPVSAKAPETQNVTNEAAEAAM